MRALSIIVAVVLMGAAKAAFAQATRPANAPMAGLLVKIEGNYLTIQPGFRGMRPINGDTSERTVSVDESARVRIDGDQAKLEDLKPGMQLQFMRVPGVRGRPDSILVYASSPSTTGIVVKVDGKNLIIGVARGPGQREEVTVPTDEKTQIAFLAFTTRETSQEGRYAKLQELKPGMRVQVIPETGTARKIFIGPTPTTRPGRSRG